MISKDRFIKIVDASESIFKNLDTNDLQGMYARLGMPVNSACLISEIQKKLGEFIIKIFASGNKEGPQSIDNLRSEIIFWGLFEKKDLRFYIRIVEVLRDQTRMLLLDATEQQWKTAIAYARAYLDLEVNQYDLSIDKYYHKEIFQFNCSQTLSSYGCSSKIRDGKLQVDSEDFSKFIDEIKKKISRWGGIPFVRRIFKRLKADGAYNKYPGRYLLYTPNMNDPQNYKATKPVGYFLNLVAQFPFEHKIEKYQEGEFLKDFAFIETVLTAILSIEDRQQTSLWSVTFLKLEKLVEFMINSAVFDASLQFTQCRLVDEISNLPILFSWVDDKQFQNINRFSLADYQIVCNAIADIVGERSGPYIFSLAELRQKLNMSRSQIELILGKISHHKDQVNRQFSALTDQHHVNVYLKPLIKLTNSKYLMYDQHWCSRGFFESLVQLTGPVFPETTDKELGIAFEKLVIDLFEAAGIETCSGFYDYFGNEGECDLIIETDDSIVIIELKKTQLSRKAQSGIDIDIFFNLSETLLKTQQQAGKLEHLLRNNGSIEIKRNDGSIKRIEWKNRVIERIAATHYDFYSFHDRVFVERFLTILMNTTWTVTNESSIKDKKVKERITNLNKIIANLTKQFAEIAMPSEERTRSFFDCWFLSLPMIQMLLTDAHSAEEFVKNLRTIKHVSFGTGSLYCEYVLTKQQKLPIPVDKNLIWHVALPWDIAHFNK